jgi:hypothetical protein
MTTTFRLRVTNEQIDVLRARLLATRWPSYDSRDDWSLGTSSDDAKRLAQYWATQYDFDSLQQRLAALPHECAVIDDATKLPHKVPHKKFCHKKFLTLRNIYDRKNAIVTKV